MLDKASLYVLRALQIAFALAVLILAITVHQHYTTDTAFNPPAQITFLIFVPCFSFCSIIYLEVFRLLPSIFIPAIGVFFELVNTLLYFVGFIAWAIFVARLSFCSGAVCTAAQMTAAAGGVEFALWAVTSIFMVRDVFGKSVTHVGDKV